jgi:Ca2+-binding RTX toxin-like protein
MHDKENNLMEPFNGLYVAKAYCLLEGDAEQSRLFTLILKRKGLNVITFSNPVEAIDNFERILNYTYNFPSSDSSRDDMINSDAGDDTTYGDNLNGTVAGGNDIINSGEGDDINNGGGEDDRIISGSDDDTNNGTLETIS